MRTEPNIQNKPRELHFLIEEAQAAYADFMRLNASALEIANSEHMPPGTDFRGCSKDHLARAYAKRVVSGYSMGAGDITDKVFAALVSEFEIRPALGGFPGRNHIKRNCPELKAELTRLGVL